MGGTTKYGTLTMVPGSADNISFVQQPTSSTVNSIISPAIRVRLNDQFGNKVSDAGTSITISLTSGNGNLSGTSI
ncbi:MAG TPA: hypothetical protein VK966_01690, partial [Longimicrobiales bacterium]|nr:hypothetical protein [Longimicrobiales bacterium]